MGWLDEGIGPALRSALTACSMQEKRSEVLWKALERAIPDVRDRVKFKLVRFCFPDLAWHAGTLTPGQQVELLFTLGFWTARYLQV